MTRDEFIQLAENGEYHTIRYNSKTEGGTINVFVFIKAIEERNVLIMDDKGRFKRLGYAKIVDVV